MRGSSLIVVSSITTTRKHCLFVIVQIIGHTDKIQLDELVGLQENILINSEMDHVALYLLYHNCSVYKYFIGD